MICDKGTRTGRINLQRQIFRYLGLFTEVELEADEHRTAVSSEGWEQVYKRWEKGCIWVKMWV